MTVNGVPQDDNLESGSAAAGLYLSYPLSVRWLVGSKLLGGYGYYKSCNTDLQKLGDRGGFVLATGISSTYLASRNFRDPLLDRLRHGAAFCEGFPPAVAYADVFTGCMCRILGGSPRFQDPVPE